MFRYIFAKANEDYTGSQLGHSEVRRIEESPTDVVSKIAELVFNPDAVLVEDRVKNTANVL